MRVAEFIRCVVGLLQDNDECLKMMMNIHLAWGKAFVFSCSVEGSRNALIVCPGNLCAEHTSHRPKKEVYQLAGPI